MDLCKSERLTLLQSDSPFIVSMKYAFQTTEDVYLGIDFMPYGDLGHFLDHVKRFSMDQTRFYAAQLVLALEHIHEQGIIYRDLKPENVLLDERGNIRLTDMGLATAGPTSGRCGTRGCKCSDTIYSSDTKANTSCSQIGHQRC